MIIEGFGISNFRSFGPIAQALGPLKKVNLIVGQNNSGKSNILRFLKNHYREIVKAVRREDRYADKGFDIPIVGANGEKRFQIGIPLEGNRFKDAIKKHPKIVENLTKALHSLEVEQAPGTAWIPFVSLADGEFKVPEDLIERFINNGPISAGD